jgi:tRNA dimethylallyltransferase
LWAGGFRQAAERASAAIRGRGNVPWGAGGTLLNSPGLREAGRPLPQADAKIRDEIDARAAREGWPALHAELVRVDPATAARLAPQDAQRIQRALEVHALTGQPLSALQGARDAQQDPGPTIVIALAPADRAALHAAIARRFDAMLTAGLVEEVRALRARYPLRPQMPSMHCAGVSPA